MAHCDRELGYKYIINEYPGFGPTAPGAKNVRERLRATGQRKERKAVLGRGELVRAEAKVAEERDLKLGNLEGGRPTTPWQGSDDPECHMWGSIPRTRRCARNDEEAPQGGFEAQAPTAVNIATSESG